MLLVSDQDQPPLLADDEEDFIYHLQHDMLIASAIQDRNVDPKTIGEARSRQDWPLWKAAMDKEVQTLEQANTWNIVACPPKKNVVGSKWVFRIKRKVDGSINKYKACLVAWGFTQIYGIDYYDTYSPVAKLTSFRTILAMAACHDWKIESFDFNSTYSGSKNCPNVWPF